MEILYEYTTGSASLPVMAIITWVLGAFLLIGAIACIICEKPFSPEHLAMILFAALGICIGFGFYADTTQQEVKATINSTVSFEEINKKYELIKQEGELYTFKVREDEE